MAKTTANTTAPYSNELSPLFDRCIARPSVPLGIIGDPGTGKTEMLESWAISRGLPMVKLLASSMDETDIAGIMVSDGKNADQLSPKWINTLKDRGVLFLDELNTARKEVADTLMTLIASRHLPNGDRLGDGVLIVAAQNDAKQCDNYELSPAMRSRFMWVKHSLPINRWLGWALGKGANKVSRPAFGSSASALPAYQTRQDWHNWFVQDEKNDGDKKALIQEAVKLGLVFDQGDDYVKKDSPTCGRSLLNLLYWARTSYDVVQWAEAFIDEGAANILRSVNVAAYKNAANAVFTNGRTQVSTGNAEEDAKLAAQQGILNKIQSAAQGTN